MDPLGVAETVCPNRPGRGHEWYTSSTGPFCRDCGYGAPPSAETVRVWSDEDVRKLLDHITALQKLLAVYRTGGRPSEKLFKELEQTKAAEWLIRTQYDGSRCPKCGGEMDGDVHRSEFSPCVLDPLENDGSVRP